MDVGERCIPLPPPKTEMSLKKGPFQKENLRSHVVMRSVWVVLWRLCGTTSTVSQQSPCNSEQTLHETNSKKHLRGLPFPRRKQGYKKTGLPFASIFRCELLVISRRIGRSLTWDPDSFFTWNVILSTKAIMWGKWTNPMTTTNCHCSKRNLEVFG